MILVIDNFDSFVHNLARYIRLLGLPTQVVRNDALSVAEIRELRPKAIVISPGPKGPQDAGVCLELVRELHTTIPMLGICLGHQVLIEAFGGKIIRSAEPTHGRASTLFHQQTQLFQGLPSPLQVGRYHSLCAEVATLPDCFEVGGTLADGSIMAVAHRVWQLFGLQFHPESVLTQCGAAMLNEFFRRAGLDQPQMHEPVQVFSAI
ncbi:MAG: aminodeoxychorismate/anthranilate synthase component II [Pirellulaceae bacterium]